MSTDLKRLAKRIRTECDELDRVLARAQVAWERAQRSADDLYLDSVALNLHGFYSGLERIFEIIATRVDGTLPTGANWHQLLLAQMAREIPSVRPAVISEETREYLDEYRGFRHVVRNVYTHNFEPERLQRLVERAPEVFQKAKAELLAFAEFLEEAEHPVDGSPH